MVQKQIQRFLVKTKSQIAAQHRAKITNLSPRIRNLLHGIESNNHANENENQKALTIAKNKK